MDPPYTLLTVESIDITDSRDYKYIFKEPNYGAFGGTIESFASLIGDISRGKNSVLGYTNATKTNYMNNLIRKQLENIDTKINAIIANPLTKQQVLDHFNRNRECTITYGFEEVPITYPDPEDDQQLKQIVKHYIVLQTKINGQITIDEYIDRAVIAQTSLHRFYKEAVQSFDPSWTGLDEKLNENSSYKNHGNKSIQSAKYGIYNNYGSIFTLLNGGILDLDSQRANTYVTNNASQDAFSMGGEVPFTATAFSLKMIVSLTHYGPSALIFALGHELGHHLGAGESDLQLSLKGIAAIERHLPREKFVDAYESKGVTNRKFKGCFGEQQADLIGILCVEGYVRTLSSPIEQLEAVRSAMMSAHEGNTSLANHPPQSMTRNLILISKYIHNLLKHYLLRKESFNAKLKEKNNLKNLKTLGFKNQYTQKVYRNQGRNRNKTRNILRREKNRTRNEQEALYGPMRNSFQEAAAIRLSLKKGGNGRRRR